MSDQIEGSGPSEKELLMNRARLLGISFSPNIGLETLRERVAAKMAELDGEETTPATPPVSEGDQSLPETVDTAQEGSDAPSFDEDIEEDRTGFEQSGNQGGEVNAFDAAAQIAAAKITTPPVSAPLKPIQPVATRQVDPSVGGGVGQATKIQPGKTPTLRQHLYNEQMKLVRLRIQNLDPKKADLNGEILTVANKHLGTIKRFVPYGEVTDDGWHLPYIIYKELERRRFLSIRTVKDPRTKQLVVKKGWAKEFALEILPPLSEGEIKQLAAAQAAAGSIDNDTSNIL